MLLAIAAKDVVASIPGEKTGGGDLHCRNKV